MTIRDRLIQIINDWADEPDSFKEWDSILKVNVLIQSEKEFGIKFNSADIPGITGLKSLLSFVEPRLVGKKVLVLDCDGVLWDGLAGENSERLSPRHFLLHEKICELESKGVLLCLCSKNNPDDVWNVIHDLNDITKSDFVASEISWDSKVDGLKRLAAKLNLGLDSFVFVDDSPIERAEVLARLPEVTVLDTVEPLEPYFKNLPGKSLTEQYRLRQTVQTALDEATDRQAFLDGLEMVATMRVNDESLAPRIAELSQKTNQFNMTLRRFTETEILERMKTGYVFCASLMDRFGDAGWTAMAVFEGNNFGGHVISDFCVSCRVLGRGFERAFIEKCFSKMRGPIIKNYVAGPKNQQCSAFFEDIVIAHVAEHVPRAPVKWEE